MCLNFKYILVWFATTPGASTVAWFQTEFENLRDSDTSRTKRLSKRLLCLVSLPTQYPLHEDWFSSFLTLLGVGNLAISAKEPVLRWNYGQDNWESDCKFSKNMLINKNKGKKTFKQYCCRVIFASSTLWIMYVTFKNNLSRFHYAHVHRSALKNIPFQSTNGRLLKECTYTYTNKIVIRVL